MMGLSGELCASRPSPVPSNDTEHSAICWLPTCMGQRVLKPPAVLFLFKGQLCSHPVTILSGRSLFDDYIQNSFLSVVKLLEIL